MKKRTIKKGEAPKVETVVAEAAVPKVKLEWKMRHHEASGLTEWVQSKAVPESRDLSVHTFNAAHGWTLTIESSMAAMSRFRTAEAAIEEAEEIVRFRLRPRPRRSGQRTAT